MTDSLRSYTARVPCVDEAAVRALDAYARRFSLAVRWVFAQQDKAILAGRTPSKAQRKQAVLERFGLTSRQANAVLVEADGKRAAQLELDDALDQSLTEQIVKKTRLLAAAQKKLEAHREGKTLRLSAKVLRDLKRRIFPLTTALARLTAKRDRLRSRTDLGLTRMTFGTKKLLRRRAGLTSEQDVETWRKQWDDARNGQFLVLGSKDEAGGCQGCVATMDATGAVTLRVRLPEVEGGGYVVLSGIRFRYGAERLAYAMAQQAVRAQAVTKVKAQVQQRKDAGDTEAKFSQKDVKAGAAITWRFMRQPDGSWRVAFSTAVEGAVRVTSRQAGVIGVDFNAGFITVTESDRFGSLMAGSRNVMLPTTGHSAGQREAAMGDAVKGLIGRCLARGKALVLEDLDFRRKKKSEVLGTSSRRKVSALAYGQFRRLCEARAHDAGVEVVFVNPAYTSTQGLVRYAPVRGWTSHQAAAGVIARRGLGFSESAPVRGTLVVSLAGSAVEWTIPAEILRSDVGLRWQKLHKGIREAIASHLRSRRGAGLALRESRRRGARIGSTKVSGENPGLKHALRVPGA